MTRTILDIHVLQTVPPSNLNRDDTGSPKSAYYGGVRRARVSSQAWKRATRTAFADHLDASELGTRTKRVVELVAERIDKLAPGHDETDRFQVAESVLTAGGIKITAPRVAKGQVPKPPESGYLLFLSAQQIDALARVGVGALTSGAAPTKAEVLPVLKGKNSIDLALFGRMVADVTDLNVDASCQVAHAISTHAVDTEFDFFTAVDDHKSQDADEDAGAGMIGTVEFNSSTLYRYATVDVDLLRANLGDDEATVRAVDAFLIAFTKSMPTGKQNTFANRTLPDAIVVSVRDDQPVSLVGAFEVAVPERAPGGRVTASAKKLAEYAAELHAQIAGAPQHTWVVGVGAAGDELAVLGDRSTFDALVPTVTGAVRDRVLDQRTGAA